MHLGTIRGQGVLSWEQSRVPVDYEITGTYEPQRHVVDTKGSVRVTSGSLFSAIGRSDTKLIVDDERVLDVVLFGGLPDSAKASTIAVNSPMPEFMDKAPRR